MNLLCYFYKLHSDREEQLFVDYPLLVVLVWITAQLTIEDDPISIRAKFILTRRKNFETGISHRFKVVYLCSRIDITIIALIFCISCR